MLTIEASIDRFKAQTFLSKFIYVSIAVTEKVYTHHKREAVRKGYDRVTWTFPSPILKNRAMILPVLKALYRSYERRAGKLKNLSPIAQ